MGSRPGRVEHLHELLEGDVLVGERGQVGLADPVQELGEGRVARGVGAQHQGVDEEPHQVVERHVGAAGDRGPDRNVRAGTQLAQQRGQPGLQDHEQRDVVGRGQLLELCVEFRLDSPFHAAAPVAGLDRTRPVETQPQLIRHSRQGAGPILHLLGDPAVGVVSDTQQLLLPQGVVGVLDRQGGPLRLHTRAPGLVGSRHVTHQRGQGPAVGGDVVNHQHEYVLLRAGAEQEGSDRQVGRQIENAVLGLLHRGGQRMLVGAVPHMQQRNGPLAEKHLLEGFAVLLGEHGAQGLVPLHHIGQRRLQRGGVQRAPQPQTERRVVRRARSLHLGEEPQPALRGRQRQQHGTGPRFEHRPGPTSAQIAGDTSDSRRPEQTPDTQLRTKHRPDPTDQPNRKQRMPTQIEETLIDPHPTHTQHIREHPTQNLLLRRPRPPPNTLTAILRHRQRPPVHLPIRSQRQHTKHHHRRRHHMIRQPPRHKPTQLHRLQNTPHLRRHIRHQTPVPRPILTDQHHHLPHPHMRHQRRLDLTQLDTETPHLHLVIDTAREHQLPVTVPPDQVTGAVHPLPRRPERTGDEALGRHARPVQVTPRQALARHRRVNALCSSASRAKWASPP
ncbi:hypothetical protein SXANM310S_04320 [Streptomyces xanthochromogenes]